MTQPLRIKRFSKVDRVFHLCLVVTFLIQAATGFGRMYVAAGWGRRVCNLFGGYENASLVHHWVGGVMMAGFAIHVLYLLSRIRWNALWQSLFGPDSLVPNLQDVRHLWQRLWWFLGLGHPPKLDRWAYWEKFDYWAVFWGMPLLAITGVMMMYPFWTSQYLPGWSLNIAALLHRAEAILAVSYIFIVHFFVGHLRRTSFPMNQAMFSGSVLLEEAQDEKPAWVERLRKEGRLETVAAKAPALWYKVIYFVFGYVALAAGVYLLIMGIAFSGQVRLH
jgi:cytochrome b subunit of formate dehydrogenase